MGDTATGPPLFFFHIYNNFGNLGRMPNNHYLCRIVSKIWQAVLEEVFQVFRIVVKGKQAQVAMFLVIILVWKFLVEGHIQIISAQKLNIACGFSEAFQSVFLWLPLQQ